MMIAFRNVLEREELSAILDASPPAVSSTANSPPANARRVKDNLQLERGSAGSKELEEIVAKALQRSATFQAAVMPTRIHPPLFSR